MGRPTNNILILASVFYFVLGFSDGRLPHMDDNKVRAIYTKPCKRYDQQHARSTSSDPFKIENSLPFNKYAFLTSHNSYPTHGEVYFAKPGRIIVGPTKDSVTQQLNTGVRALKLDALTDFAKGGVTLCHGCHANRRDGLTSAALPYLKEVEEFLTSNPSEIVTLIIEDHVETPYTLGKVFDDAGLTKYMLPLSKMPRNGEDWPLVKDMVSQDQRLVVFTSSRAKQESEGIAYKWNFMTEYKYGRKGMDTWSCTKRENLSPQVSTNKSLVLLNYYSKLDFGGFATCNDMNIEDLMNAIGTCHNVAANQWSNFIAIDYGEEINVGPAFQAVDFLNGKLLCGCDNVNSCKGGSWCHSEVDFGDLQVSSY